MRFATSDLPHSISESSTLSISIPTATFNTQVDPFLQGSRFRPVRRPARDKRSWDCAAIGIEIATFVCELGLTTWKLVVAYCDDTHARLSVS